ncbi:RDD family protein [Streptomyces sp. NPDC047081]|uniref:RDD family protein n=1 Tax=Streptomyces sp. NPDC047081 TaxID=3154706 RepID=UPI0033DB3307
MFVPKLRRAMAWFIDFALVLTLAAGLAVLTFHRIAGLVTDVPELAARGGLDLLSSRGDVIGASADFGVSLWDKVVFDVEEAFGVLVVATFLYQWGCLVLAGRTVGKGLLGLKVTPCAPRRAAVRALVTTAADIAVYAVACVLLIERQFVLSVMVWALAVLFFLFNALPVLSPTRRSFADRVAGTTVTGLGISTPGATPPVRTF